MAGDGVRGHADYRGLDGQLRHLDDGSLCEGPERCTRPCVECGLPPVNGHDACIANLPGVLFACCGHGDPGEAYIKFENGIVVRHFDEIETSTSYQGRGDRSAAWPPPVEALVE